ncbi:methyl-accepting chemotaxis protein [Massilia dura]|uniref:Methyl-accepting chemotaxis protein n=1 Tax=Pseudoduganella dura TaxID=321982 RepID=A0A6I3XLF4_9BURK|nr:methyl-accepting chemotaxis protein [Pseudoduganella dura]MUI12565.1 methyl-accepting chemotaxis protein [Pseudoduganella dura]GGY03989.1 methyl-accepting chemotaxis protein [Pseudoduganella dura]
MNWLTERKLSTKLGLAFAVVLLLTAIVGLFSINQLAKVNATASNLSSRWMPAMRVIQDIKSQIARVRTRELQYIISEDVADLDKYDKVIANDLVDLKKMQDEYVALIKTPEEQALYSEFLTLWDRYMAEDAKLRAAVRAGDMPLAKKLIRGESNKLIVALRGQVDKLVKYYGEGGSEAASFGDQVYNASRAWIAGLLLMSVVLGALAALLITRWLVKTLGGEPQYAVALANQIAAGELNVEVRTRAGDDTSLLFAMKSMRDSLANIVGQVRHATDTIASAAQQVVAGNMDLSGRTEAQASSLEETAASMEELTSTVRHNSDNARQANELAVNASAIAEQGGQVVSQVVERMGSINESAKKISDITGVIDGIAFQTNILALNAAVEAARAGEQGRGFAVVASEVRNLAQRSAAAAREIKELISDSVGQVEAGTRLVNQAGSTMEEVVVSVRRVTDIMGEITVAGQEQSAGIVQVNEAIAQMDAVTQQNAALVEEATAASHSMQDQASSLAQLVSIFTLDGLANHQYSAASSAKRTDNKTVRLNRPRQ